VNAVRAVIGAAAAVVLAVWVTLFLPAVLAWILITRI
jgi:hypothetical protein